MRFLEKGAAILIMAALLLSASAIGALASSVSLTTSDGANISFNNQSADEVGKPITDLIANSASAQPKKEISRVITVKSESIELIPTDIYIRVSAEKKSAAEGLDIEITDSSGKVIESEKTRLDEDKYLRDFYLGCFSSDSVTQTRIYTLICKMNDDVEISVVSKPRRSANKQTDEGEKTIKRVGDGVGEIKSGAYYASTLKQMKITSASGDVVLFRASGTAMTPETILLNDGDTIEYYSPLYLSTVSENIKYLPFGTGSLMQMAPGGYSEISEGKIVVYNESGIPLMARKNIFTDNVSAYIMNHGTLMNEQSEAYDEAEKIKLDSGFLYTVGVEIIAGSYEGSGEGTIRVYDSAGYVKTVIKLKNENSSSEGVESYVFRLNDNETLVADGNIEFKEVN